uniref:Uncharacterized protein n=1 Tax=Arundo donax TaxID=35708 RepID=A0A0A9FM86_ARUDO
MISLSLGFYLKCDISALEAVVK